MLSSCKAGGHLVWASATLTCCHISRCTEGDKGIKPVLSWLDISTALRSALVCLRSWNTVSSFSVSTPKIVCLLRCHTFLKWPEWFPSVKRRECRNIRFCIVVFFRLSDTSVTNGLTPVQDNALVWSGQGWVFAWCVVMETHKCICI